MVSLGSCAIPIGFIGMTFVDGSIFKTVVDGLYQRCLGSPTSPRSGRTAISKLNPRGQKWRRGDSKSHHASKQ